MYSNDEGDRKLPQGLGKTHSLPGPPKTSIPNKALVINLLIYSIYPGKALIIIRQNKGKTNAFLRCKDMTENNTEKKTSKTYDARTFSQ